MKTRNSTGLKKRATRDVSRRTSPHDVINAPRLYLFLEVFVDKAIPQRSTK
jgi:hypothetical protein